MEKIKLTAEKETLLIPLYGKAMESKQVKPLLIDRKALEIVEAVDYDFASLHIPRKTNVMMCLRATMMDATVADFLKAYPEGVVLHLGCGLDARILRVQQTHGQWYDVDFEEVIDLRRHFYQDGPSYHQVGSSVTAPGWIEALSTVQAPVLVVAEGLMMYLRETEIQELLMRLKKHFGAYTLLFDAYSTLTAKSAKNHPSLKRTGAVIHWGLDEPESLSHWDADIRFIRESAFSDCPQIAQLSGGMRTMFRLAGVFKMARRAHRVLTFQVGDTMNKR